MPITTDAPAQGFVLVEDGQDGIKTRFFLNRPAAEAALISTGLEYKSAGEAAFTKAQLEEYVRLMREAEDRNESYVVECPNLGALWINVVAIES